MHKNSLKRKRHNVTRKGTTKGIIGDRRSDWGFSHRELERYYSNPKNGFMNQRPHDHRDH